MQNYMFDLSTPKGGLQFSIERTSKNENVFTGRKQTKPIYIMKMT